MVTVNGYKHCLESISKNFLLRQKRYEHLIIYENSLLAFPTETIAGESFEMFCCCGRTLAIGSTVVVLLFEFADVTIFTFPRTICEIFVATDAGNVVTDVPLNEVCVARDVIVNGTTVGFCCAF